MKVEIVNANGQVVDTVDMGGQGAGRHLFNWDSSKYAGSTDGLRFRVTALNGNTQVGTTSLALSKVVAAGARGRSVDAEPVQRPGHPLHRHQGHGLTTGISHNRIERTRPPRRTP